MIFLSQHFADDYDRPVASKLFQETPELSAQAEKLCESDDEALHGGMEYNLINIIYSFNRSITS